MRKRSQKRLPYHHLSVTKHIGTTLTRLPIYSLPAYTSTPVPYLCLSVYLSLAASRVFSPDYTCALQRDILLQGRLYLSENWLCFYSNVFWGTKVSSHMRERKNKGTVFCLGDELNWIMIYRKYVYILHYSGRVKDVLCGRR